MSGSFRKGNWPLRWAVASPSTKQLFLAPQALELMLGTTSVRRSRASGYLAQVETGVRPISKKIAEKLEVVFGVKRGRFTQAVFRRGRPPRGAEAQQALRQIQLATGKAPRALESSGPPRHPRADR